jgi:hypothetical protein
MLHFFELGPQVQGSIRGLESGLRASKQSQSKAGFKL